MRSPRLLSMVTTCSLLAGSGALASFLDTSLRSQATLSLGTAATGHGELISVSDARGPETVVDDSDMLTRMAEPI